MSIHDNIEDEYTEKISKLQAENDKLRNENVNLANDLCYHKAILDGSWPSSQEILKQALNQSNNNSNDSTNSST
ncbi:hypothetical protein LCGC14_2516240 [marine sediment metagenome]|uniref:Uncharacterized protein n=1 Tax=marine sediment metagenome TaxID=412755 RepID=A0A0F9BKN5_9ZZZZ